MWISLQIARVDENITIEVNMLLLKIATGSRLSQHVLFMLTVTSFAGILSSNNNIYITNTIIHVSSSVAYFISNECNP